jgi:glycosyltransferase involved in cell wall biosynthesis
LGGGVRKTGKEILMKILHITVHMGGGVGTVIYDWMGKVNIKPCPIGKPNHEVVCLDYVNEKSRLAVFADNLDDDWLTLFNLMGIADIVLVNWWDHPMLERLINTSWPPCRLVFWAHKNYDIPKNITKYPDRFIVTSPIQGSQYDCIKSTGNMERFLKLEKVAHEGFNVGYAGTIHPRKIHPMVFDACRQISERIPAKFTFCGDVYDKYDLSKFNFNLPGKVDDVAPYLATMDVFGYPLRPDHYGTSEIVLGEAMAAGLPVVCMDNPCERLIVEDGVTGFLCKTEQEYVENIEHLYHKPALRNWMGWNARVVAREMYDINAMVKKWNEVFDQMMNEPKKEHKLHE